MGPSFRFSVKLPKSITHERRLVDVEALLDAFADEVRLLGEKLAVVLVQLPPSLAFDAASFDAFRTQLAERVPATVALEPRHPSWFEEGIDEFLAARHVVRVAADPAVAPGAAVPGGWPEFSYYRLHGSPVTYRSPYGGEFLRSLAARLGPGDWCIFDNTASGAALPNALELLARLARRSAEET